MNTLNTLFDDSLFLDMDEMETSPQELEEIIGELFQEESYEQPSLEEETLLDDSFVMTDLYDMDV